MRELTWQQTRQMLLFVADEIIAQKPFLTEIDSKIGDGDHGIGMETGMKKVKARLAATEEGTDVYQLLTETGKAMLMSMGGASGVIFGTMFLGGAKGKTPLGNARLRRDDGLACRQPRADTASRQGGGRRQDDGRCAGTGGRGNAGL